MPIVLHGGTGVPVEQVRKAISLGVGKVNFSTRLRKAYISRLQEIMQEDPENLDFMAILGEGQRAFKEDARAMLRDRRLDWSRGVEAA